MKRITWFLGNKGTIEKEGAGAQQVFGTLSPRERQAITLYQERVVEQELFSSNVKKDSK